MYKVDLYKLKKKIINKQLGSPIIFDTHYYKLISNLKAFTPYSVGQMDNYLNNNHALFSSFLCKNMKLLLF